MTTTFPTSARVKPQGSVAKKRLSPPTAPRKGHLVLRWHCSEHCTPRCVSEWVWQPDEE